MQRGSNALVINDTLAIDPRELSFTFSRSAGPGGQNVNKVATRVTLLFDVANSPSLSPSHRSRLRRRLATRISQEGILRISCRRNRSQAANRRGAIERFVELLAEALRPAVPRKKTRPTRASADRRLAAKRRRGDVKRSRQSRYRPDDE